MPALLFGPFQLSSGSPASYLFKSDASQLAHIVNDANSHSSSGTAIPSTVYLHIAIRAAQHHGHLAAVLCSASGRGYARPLTYSGGGAKLTSSKYHNTAQQHLRGTGATTAWKLLQMDILFFPLILRSRVASI
ncbi:hypothetical protein PpBr36_08585, partial [Pyricularia pennisetigena]|uniref:hypothetical protein n=1 Tax=Pyricularia pennisetigena TaxID=1578925 RepID=UPI001154760E